MHSWCLVLSLIAVFLVGAPNIYAQEIWKTYISSSDFSIDYPIFDKPVNITKEKNKQYQYDMTIIDSNQILTIITKQYNPTDMDVQELAVIDMKNKNILENLKTDFYDGEIGYTYVYNEKNIQDMVNSVTYIQRGDYNYDVSIMGLSDNTDLHMIFDKILHSIKFFD